VPGGRPRRPRRVLSHCRRIAIDFSVTARRRIDAIVPMKENEQQLVAARNGSGPRDSCLSLKHFQTEN